MKGQSNGLGISVGMATFSAAVPDGVTMNEKYHLENFPLSHFFKLHLNFKLDTNLVVGLIYSNATTNVKTYSDGINIDFDINTIGLCMEQNLKRFDDYRLAIGMELGLEYLTIEDINSIENENGTYKSTKNSMYLNPYIVAYYRYGVFEYGAFCGYYYEKLSEYKYYMDGYRFGLKLNLIF
jgi:hypothetical protein